MTSARATSSDRFRAAFPSRPVLLVVVHVTSAEQAVRNAETARDAGCDGVFLINHGISSSSLRLAWDEVVAALPDLWTGVNDLSLSAPDIAAAYPGDLQGIWEDHTVLASDGPAFDTARQNARRRLDRSTGPLLFGGVAFKYGPDEGLIGTRLAELASASRAFVDVVTTSGPGTGRPADVEKIATIRRAIGDFPLAIASGVTVDNVGDYLPLADCFLVASGISRSFDELDPYAVTALARRVHHG